MFDDLGFMLDEREMTIGRRAVVNPRACYRAGPWFPLWQFWKWPELLRRNYNFRPIDGPGSYDMRGVTIYVRDR